MYAGRNQWRSQNCPEGGFQSTDNRTKDWPGDSPHATSACAGRGGGCRGPPPENLKIRCHLVASGDVWLVNYSASSHTFFGWFILLLCGNQLMGYLPKSFNSGYTQTHNHCRVPDTLDSSRHPKQFQPWCLIDDTVCCAAFSQNC